jgi:UDP-GlcNAc:undecaprenyl-phosphate GlcNAc-1-phosphate transferase
MATGWATAFLAAVLLTMLGTPLVRRVALATGFLDQPAAHKSHAGPIPYLGGVAVIVGAMVGFLAGPGVVPRIAVVAVGACVMGAVGLLDDSRPLGLTPRLAAQTSAAIAAIAAGVSMHATRITILDWALTLVWIVGITNAFNLLDNMDGLAGGVAAVVAAGAFTLAALGGQVVVAGLTAALTGACLGFLAYNIRPAAIFMGDAGSLFLGFLLAVAALELDPSLPQPASFTVPILLLAVPLLDTGTVSLARLRRGRSVAHGGRDHLSHRLVARGLSPGMAVVVLVATSLACALAAVAAGRRLVPLAAALGGGVILIGALGLFTTRVAVYDIPVIGLPRRLWHFAAGAVLVGGLLSAPAVVALVDARTTLRSAAVDARAGLAAASAGRPVDAVRNLHRAARDFAAARTTLGRPGVSLALAVPGLASNVRAARALSAVGHDLAAEGARLSAAIDPTALRVRAGRVPVDAIRRITPDLVRGSRALHDARARIDAIDTTYLVAAVRTAHADLVARLGRASRDADRAVAAVRVAPAMLGADGPRRYFLAVENTAELRATGGFIGNWGEITADDGRLRLTRFGRIAELNGGGGVERVLRAPTDFLNRYGRFDITRTWQNVNMSPDFPTVARVIGELYPQAGGTPIDGVIAVDPEGLAALLAATGPVSVTGWPDPLTPDNVVAVTLRDEYERFAQPDRVEFLGAVANAVWQRFTTVDLPEPSVLGRTLSAAAHGKHLMLESLHRDEARMLSQIGVTGAVPPPRGDGLLLVNQNAAGNKIDYYLRRHVDLDVHLEPVAHEHVTTTGVRAHIRASLENTAPDHGLSRTAIGPFTDEFAAGENRTFLSVYSRHDFLAAQLDGAPTTLESTRELGRKVYSTFISIPSHATRRLDLDLDGLARLGPGGWYALDLTRQAVPTPDTVTVRLDVPRGWRIAETVGLSRRDTRHASRRLTLRRDETVWVRLERNGLARLWDRLHDAR